jgi:hypothetical protein
VVTVFGLAKELGCGDSFWVKVSKGIVPCPHRGSNPCLTDHCKITLLVTSFLLSLGSERAATGRLCHKRVPERLQPSVTR